MPVDELWYPLPRRRRAGPPSAASILADQQQQEFPAPPRVRLFPFIFDVIAARRSTVSTPRLLGPAILRRIYYQILTSTDPPQDTLEFGWTVNPVTETNVLLTVARPYTSMMEKVDPQALTLAGSGDGFLNWTIPNTFIRWEITPNWLITEPQFSFTVAHVNPSANAHRTVGTMTVLEAVPADQVAEYMKAS